MSNLAREHWKSHPRYTGVVVASLSYLRRPGHEDGGTVLHMEGAARRFGFHLNHLNLHEFRSMSRVEGILTNRGVEGILLGACQCPWSRLDLDWNRWVCVAWNNSEFAPPFDWVTNDYAKATALACRELRSRKRRRVGLVILRDVPTDDHWRITSAFRFFQGAGEPVFQAGFEESDRVLQWIRNKKLDGVVSNSSLIGWWLQETGALYPGAVAFVSLELEPDSPMTGVLMNHHVQVNRALELLDQGIRMHRRGPPDTPLRIQLEPVWREGIGLPPPADGHQPGTGNEA